MPAQSVRCGLCNREGSFIVKGTMTRLLYWLIYHVDLGPLGPRLLDFAVKHLLRRARKDTAQPLVRQRAYGLVTAFHLHPADERM
jgi:hypothetical protein